MFENERRSLVHAKLTYVRVDVKQMTKKKKKKSCTMCAIQLHRVVYIRLQNHQLFFQCATHSAALVYGDVWRHEVDEAPPAPYHGRVRVGGAEARLAAGDKPAEAADAERLPEVPHHLRHEWVAYLVAANADESNAVVGREPSHLPSIN